MFKIFRAICFTAAMQRHEHAECSQRPGATERKQRKCPHCGDWFVTTQAMFEYHEKLCPKKPWSSMIDCDCYDLC
ncbi:MAG: hypothetical protein UY31_C0048G0002 [Candidatus Wolfebacteria bacterium GW2011_GWE1_48_7]|nr:MAG: hypothetical protein UY31_C0048G0002 [Candidatus Wolfebacteria bacterium GW2011_GWE1_48_7]